MTLKPQSNEAPHRENATAAARVFPVRPCYVGTEVSALQSAEIPKDVNTVMARLEHPRAACPARNTPRLHDAHTVPALLP